VIPPFTLEGGICSYDREQTAPGNTERFAINAFEGLAREVNPKEAKQALFVLLACNVLILRYTSRRVESD